MIINNSLDEVKKRESAFNIIKKILREKGRDSLYDVTGLSGAFIADEEDLDLLETYVGPAVFEDELQIVGCRHLGGEKVLGVNRTSAGILATVLALVEKGSHVSHFLAKYPGHPSIPRSCQLVGATYSESVDIDEFEIPDNTSLVVVTGSTMDLEVIDEDLFKRVIEMAHERNIPVLVDDASGARLRTAIFNQSKAIDLGADLVVTSTDKLMPGPRGGLMAGRQDLIDLIKIKVNQFGLEAQAPLVLAMVNGIKAYTEENLVKSIIKKDEFYDLVCRNYEMFEKTPNGLLVSESSLQNQLEVLAIDTKLSSNDCCFLWAMVLLYKEGIITIPAVGMPGASNTIRFDLSAPDVIDMDLNLLYEKIDRSFNKFLTLVENPEEAEKLIFFSE